MNLHVGFRVLRFRFKVQGSGSWDFRVGVILELGSKQFMRSIFLALATTAICGVIMRIDPQPKT